MTWEIDHRWSPGNSRATVPDEARAAYAARWIDQGIGMAGDVLHDRQGAAYNDKTDLYELLDRLNLAKPHVIVGFTDVPRDVAFHLYDGAGIQVWCRRAGGYYYVDAWLS